MADMKEVMAAFERLGREARAWADVQVSANARQDDFQLVSACSSADMKAAAAYHPLDPRVFKPTATFVTGTPPQSAQERRKFLQITKASESFLLRLPASAPENLLGRQGHRHFGDWRVEVVEDDCPLLLESFDEHHEAVAYVAYLLATVGDESTDDEHEYASVGEVPC